MRRLSALLLRSFLQGLIILGPIGVTAYAIYFVFISIDGLIPGLEKIGPGIGFVSVVLIITIVGYIGTRFFLGRWIVEAFDSILEHTPGIKHIYSSVKDVLDSFMGDKKKFTHAVWVKTNEAPEIWRIGFLTQKDMSKYGHENKVSVYLPHSYAISGWVVIVDVANIKAVEEMTAAEAMKFAVSGGITGAGE